MEPKPIETMYNDYRFRSRLEARWAVFFDTVGIEYEYEQEGYDLGKLGWYLPDFWLPSCNMWAEVKGQQFTLEEEAKARKLSTVETMYSPIDSIRPEHGCSYGILKLIGLQTCPNLPGYHNSVNGVREGNFMFIHSDRYEYGPIISLDAAIKVAIRSAETPKRYAEILRDSMNSFRKGIKAAKSARFEYGETPKFKTNSTGYSSPYY